MRSQKSYPSNSDASQHTMGLHTPEGQGGVNWGGHGGVNWGGQFGPIVRGRIVRSREDLLDTNQK